MNGWNAAYFTAAPLRHAGSVKGLWTLLLFLTLGSLQAQSVWVLEDCAQAYIDPQDEIGNTEPGRDTLRYTTTFETDTLLRAYYIDINAFGGQQADRARVYALMPDGSRKLLGGMAFGNCIDCLEGFALVQGDSILVQGVTDRNIMDLWIQSQGQPPFELTGNLQTLSGVGRLSGTVPFCATGLQVDFVVYSNPSSTSTEFSTYIHCPVPVAPCTISKEVNVDCQQDSISLRALLPAGCFSGPVAVRWSNDRGWSAEGAEARLPLSGNEGMYYLSVSDDCCTYLDSVLIENPDFADAGPDQLVCRGTALSLAGSGGSGHFWEGPQGMAFNDSLLFLPEVQAADDGPYILHAFNEEGCEDTDTLQLTVNIPPDPEISFTEVCLGETLEFQVGNDSVYTQISWLGPDGSPLNGNAVPNFQLSDIGQYTFSARDSLECEVQESVPVSGFEPPEVETVIEDNCDSTRVYLIPDTYQYQWETGETGPNIATATGGNFQLTITDSQGCRSVLQLNVPPPDGPDVELELEQPLCPNDYGAIRFRPANPDEPLIYSIDGGETYSLSPRFDKLLPGVYPLAVQDGLGCIQQSTVTLAAPDTLAVNLNIEELKVRPTTPVTLIAQTIGNVERFQWLPKEIDTERSISSFTAMRDMDVRIIVEDGRGCRASDGFQLSIVLGDIYVPNAFSPNGDGRNDRFVFFSDRGSGEIIEYLRVYDRFGGLLYEDRDIELNDTDRGWDGTSEGRQIDAGLYTYQGVVRFGNGERKLFKGDIMLVR